MEIAGVAGVMSSDVLKLEKTDKTTGKVIHLEICHRALPMGFHEENERLFPSPQPPKKGFLKDKRGAWIRDPMTKKPVIDYDYASVKYREDVRIVNRVHTMRMLEEAWFKFDDKAVLKAQRTDFEDKKNGLRDYYLAIFGELQEFGFTSGDFATIINSVLRLSAQKDEEIEEVTEGDFLSEDELLQE